MSFDQPNDSQHPQQPQWGPANSGYAADRSFNPNGIVPLRPLNLGELFDGAFKAIRKNPKVMFGFSAIVLVLLGLLTLASNVWLSRTSTFGQMFTSGNYVSGIFVGIFTTLVPALITSLGTLILSGMLVYAVSRAVIGEFVSVQQLWAAIKPRLGTLIAWGFVIMAATVVLAVVVMALPAFMLFSLLAGASDTSIGFMALGSIGILLAALIIALWIYMKLIFTSPIIVLEQLSIGAAMKRSWNLVKGFTWRSFGVMLLTYMIVGIIAAILTIPATIPAAATIDPVTMMSPLWVETLLSVASTIASIVTYPFAAAMLSLLYIDTRMRKEGLDIQLQQNVHGE